MDGATLCLRAAHEIAAPSAVCAAADDLWLSAKTLEIPPDLAGRGCSRLLEPAASSLEPDRREALGNLDAFFRAARTHPGRGSATDPGAGDRVRRSRAAASVRRSRAAAPVRHSRGRGFDP